MTNLGKILIPPSPNWFNYHSICLDSKSGWYSFCTKNSIIIGNIKNYYCGSISCGLKSRPNAVYIIEKKRYEHNLKKSSISNDNKYDQGMNKIINDETYTQDKLDSDKYPTTCMTSSILLCASHNDKITRLWNIECDKDKSLNLRCELLVWNNSHKYNCNAVLIADNLVITGDEKGRIISFEYLNILNSKKYKKQVESLICDYCPLESSITVMKQIDKCLFDDKIIIAVGYSNGSILMIDIYNSNILKDFGYHSTIGHKITCISFIYRISEKNKKVDPKYNSMEEPIHDQIPKVKKADSVLPPTSKEFILSSNILTINSYSCLMATSGIDDTTTVWDIMDELSPKRYSNLPKKIKKLDNLSKKNRSGYNKGWTSVIFDPRTKNHCNNNKELNSSLNLLIIGTYQGDLLHYNLNLHNVEKKLNISYNAIFYIEYYTNKNKYFLFCILMDRNIVIVSLDNWIIEHRFSTFGAWIASITSPVNFPHLIYLTTGDGKIFIMDSLDKSNLNTDKVVINDISENNFIKIKTLTLFQNLKSKYSSKINQKQLEFFINHPKYSEYSLFGLKDGNFGLVYVDPNNTERYSVLILSNKFSFGGPIKDIYWKIVSQFDVSSKKSNKNDMNNELGIYTSDTYGNNNSDLPATDQSYFSRLFKDQEYFHYILIFGDKGNYFLAKLNNETSLECSFIDRIGIINPNIEILPIKSYSRYDHVNSNENSIWIHSNYPLKLINLSSESYFDFNGNHGSYICKFDILDISNKQDEVKLDDCNSKVRLIPRECIIVSLTSTPAYCIITQSCKGLHLGIFAMVTKDGSISFITRNIEQNKEHNTSIRRIDNNISDFDNINSSYQSQSDTQYKLSELLICDSRLKSNTSCIFDKLFKSPCTGITSIDNLENIYVVTSTTDGFITIFSISSNTLHRNNLENIDIQMEKLKVEILISCSYVSHNLYSLINKQGHNTCINFYRDLTHTIGNIKNPNKNLKLLIGGQEQCLYQVDFHKCIESTKKNLAKKDNKNEKLINEDLQNNSAYIQNILRDLSIVESNLKKSIFLDKICPSVDNSNINNIKSSIEFFTDLLNNSMSSFNRKAWIDGCKSLIYLASATIYQQSLIESFSSLIYLWAAKTEVMNRIDRNQLLEFFFNEFIQSQELPNTSNLLSLEIPFISTYNQTLLSSNCTLCTNFSYLDNSTLKLPISIMDIILFEYSEEFSNDILFLHCLGEKIQDIHKDFYQIRRIPKYFKLMPIKYSPRSTIEHTTQLLNILSANTSVLYNITNRKSLNIHNKDEFFKDGKNKCQDISLQDFLISPLFVHLVNSLISNKGLSSMIMSHIINNLIKNIETIQKQNLEYTNKGDSLQKCSTLNYPNDSLLNIHEYCILSVLNGNTNKSIEMYLSYEFYLDALYISGLYYGLDHPISVSIYKKWSEYLISKQLIVQSIKCLFAIGDLWSVFIILSERIKQILNSADFFLDIDFMKNDNNRNFNARNKETKYKSLDNEDMVLSLGKSVKLWIYFVLNIGYQFLANQEYSLNKTLNKSDINSMQDIPNKIAKITKDFVQLCMDKSKNNINVIYFALYLISNKQKNNIDKLEGNISYDNTVEGSSTSSFCTQKTGKYIESTTNRSKMKINTEDFVRSKSFEDQNINFQHIQKLENRKFFLSLKSAKCIVNNNLTGYHTNLTFWKYIYILACNNKSSKLNFFNGTSNPNNFNLLWPLKHFKIIWDFLSKELYYKYQVDNKNKSNYEQIFLLYKKCEYLPFIDGSESKEMNLSLLFTRLILLFICTSEYKQIETSPNIYSYNNKIIDDTNKCLYKCSNWINLFEKVIYECTYIILESFISSINGSNKLEQLLPSDHIVILIIHLLLNESINTSNFISVSTCCSDQLYILYDLQLLISLLNLYESKINYNDTSEINNISVLCSILLFLDSYSEYKDINNLLVDNLISLLKDDNLFNSNIALNFDRLDIPDETKYLPVHNLLLRLPLNLQWEILNLSKVVKCLATKCVDSTVINAYEFLNRSSFFHIIKSYSSYKRITLFRHLLLKVNMEETKFIKENQEKDIPNDIIVKAFVDTPYYEDILKYFHNGQVTIKIVINYILKYMIDNKVDESQFIDYFLHYITENDNTVYINKNRLMTKYLFEIMSILYTSVKIS
ncbi:hypothetical protein ACR3K2_34100 [Cryptosporidium serpentis]